MLISLKRISTALGLLAAAAAVAQAQTPAAGYNQATANAVAGALRSSPNLTPYRIEIETVNGLATLSGNVATAAQRNEALALASSVPGVAGVIDRLVVGGDSRVRPVQYQPGSEPRIAGGQPYPGHGPGMMGGQPYAGPGAGAPGGGEIIYDGPAPGPGGYVGGPGGYVGGPAVGQPGPMGAMDGPMAEGPAGAPGATQSAMPRNPNYSWPSYAPYPNFSAVGYPTAYPWQAWPNIAAPYPYPEVPLDWRAVTLRWDDGIWWLDFKKHYTRPFFTPYPFGIFAY
jgi:hypothetical protein